MPTRCESDLIIKHGVSGQPLSGVGRGCTGPTHTHTNITSSKMMLNTWTLLMLLAALDVVNSQCSDISSVIAHDGTPVGTEEVINGGE